MAGDRDAREAPRAGPPARQFALRLLGRTQDSTSGESAGDAARVACDNLYWELSRWVGFDGCHALFTRALATARIDHPALKLIALRVRSDPYIDGIPQGIAMYGELTVAAALEAMLMNVVDLLGRIIGEDMAARLIEQSIASTGNSANDGNNGSRKEP